MQDTFGLTQMWESDLIMQWLQLSGTMTIDDFETRVIAKLRQTLLKYSDTWNEIERIEYFIGPLLTFLDFNTDYFKLFSERRISAVVGEYELYGEPDALIAKGSYTPKIPYFCFHEYKRIEEQKGDVRGQLLAEMLAAQTLNQNRVPVYGVYVVEKDWQFVVLHGNAYCISNSYVASQEDHLAVIVKLLKALKAILIEIAKQDA